MDPNIMLMVIMKYLKQARDEPIRYAEITMQKVIRLFYLYMRYKELQDDRKNREMWVRPIFTERRRLLQGDSDNLIMEMRLEDPNKYFNYLRMSAVIFNELLNIVGPLIEKENVVRKPIPARTRLEVTIRWLASGDSMTSLSYAYRIAQCTLSRIIPETCEAIWLALKEKFMIDPTEDNWRTIAEDFATTCQFPNCIGAIDGKHVVIQAPPRSGSCYYNYKGNHSINLLAVSDAKNRFTIVDIGTEGRQSDGGVFESSGLPHLFQTNALHIPPPTRLNNMDFEFPNVLLGDEAFPLSTHMMRPYPRSRRLNISRKIFNYRLSRARRTVECAFGILVARWRIYRQPILACTSTAVKAVQAMVILHNFIINEELDLPLAERQYCNIQEERNLSATNELTDIRNSSSRKSKALKIRDNFAHYFEHVNPLPWQWDKVLTNNF
ncbi:PREDICTED: putative nuclease HARBI1 [Cyphomyrmex costatus]|uniref:putative nuclease HARBI1 n=1 Tax=Cyphomyrmex costatus TaxID=456900 RepID=UPI0008522112|nr:PREDICTED: putative nuclease HARBI1 [Cyphomyrmex costatus]